MTFKLVENTVLIRKSRIGLVYCVLQCDVIGYLENETEVTPP